MISDRFDHMTRALAASRSRRQVMLGFGGAIVAGGQWPERARGGHPAPLSPYHPSPRPPSFVSPHPIPLRGGTFLINGSVVAPDLQALLTAFQEGAAAIPIVVDEATYRIDATLLARALQLSTPVADPDSSAATPTAIPTQLRDGPPPVEVLEQVCGADETQDVELYNGDLGVSKTFVACHQQKVGVLRWKGNLARLYEEPGNVNGVRWCSGILIAHDLFLTAGHCLSPFPPDPEWLVPRINGTDKPIPNTEVATNMKVEFNYQLDEDGNDRDPEPFAVVELVEYVYSLDVDYAILRLDGAPGQRFGVTRVAARDVPVGSRICVIGHPQGQAKRIAAGTATEYTPGRLYYRDLDTAGGSSGSGILASPEGPLVGVHTAGGCLDSQTGNNHGVPISSLLGASPILRDLCGQA